MPGAGAPDHQSRLGVRLETDDAVDDMDAGLLQLGRPCDVRLLVEARGQLDERDHLLARLGGSDEGADDRAVGAGRPVEGLLDGEHVGIAHRLVDEGFDAACEQLVGVMHEHVALIDHPEDVHLALVAGGFGERRRDHRRWKALLEIGPVQLIQTPEAAEVERPVDRVDVLCREFELAHEQPLDLLRHGRRSRGARPGASAGGGGGTPAPRCAGPPPPPPRAPDRRCASLGRGTGR